jgi:hypothetical protein
VNREIAIKVKIVKTVNYGSAAWYFNLIKQIQSEEFSLLGYDAV